MEAVRPRSAWQRQETQAVLALLCGRVNRIDRDKLIPFAAALERSIRRLWCMMMS